MPLSDRAKKRGRERARAIYPDSSCEWPDCGQPGQRHHRDGNPLNNAPDNVVYLCAWHHMLEDGRLAALIARNRATKGKRLKPRRPCSNCGVTPQEGAYLRNGRCPACAEYRRRHGCERPLFLLAR